MIIHFARNQISKSNYKKNYFEWEKEWIWKLDLPKVKVSTNIIYLEYIDLGVPSSLGVQLAHLVAGFIIEQTHP